MLNRRKFLKLFGLTSLALSFLPTIFMKQPFSKHYTDIETKSRVKNRLYGSPRRGCSTPDLAFENQEKRAKGLRDLVG
jgi:hypothetical protein